MTPVARPRVDRRLVVEVAAIKQAIPLSALALATQNSNELGRHCCRVGADCALTPCASGCLGFLDGTTPMASPGANNVQHNHILNAMSNADLALLQPHLERVPLNFRQRLNAGV